MGIFSKLFNKSNSDSEEDFSYIIEIAKLISDNDSDVVKQLSDCVNDPWGYGEKREERYLERGISVACEDTTNADEICWIGLVDELAAHGFLSGADYKCELSDFLWSLEQLKNYSLIADVVYSLKLNQNEDIEAWGVSINEALEGNAFVCMIDVDSDSYEIIIADADIYEKILDIARINGHIINCF